MLVLARKKGEVVRIGEEISVTVLDIRGDVIRLGISAPRQLAVHRLEVYQEIEQENRQAVNSQLNLTELGDLQRK